MKFYYFITIAFLFFVICAYENFAQSKCNIIPPNPRPAYQQGNWPIESDGYYSFPSQYYAIGDVNYDGRLELVFSLLRWIGGDVNDINNYVPYIEIYDAFGELIHRFTPEGGMPTLVDIDGDGTLEMVTQTCGVHVYHWDGTPVSGGLYKWPYTDMNGAIGTPLAIDDIDGDGVLEVVGATKNYCGPGTNHTEVGKIYVWDIYGNLKPGWPQQVPISISGTYPGVWHTPTIGDLDGDGYKEIVIPSVGCPDWSSTGYNFFVYRHDGSLLWQQKSVGDTLYSNFGYQPIIADIDNDGKPEVVASSGNRGRHIAFNGEDGSIVDGWPLATGANTPIALNGATLSSEGYVSIFFPWGRPVLVRGDGTFVDGWPVDLGEEWDPCFLTCSPYSGNAAVIGDIDGSGEPDIFIPATSWICLPPIPIGKIFAADIKGNWLEGYPYMCPGYPPDFVGWYEDPQNPIITDIDLDGDVEIGFVSSTRLHFFDLPAPFDPTTLHWPKHGQNNQRTAYYEPPETYIPRVDEVNGVSHPSARVSFCQGEPSPEIEVRGAYFESKPFVWFVPETDKTAFFKGDLSKGLPAQSVWMEPAPLRRGNYLRVTPPALPIGKYELVVQNPTGIRNVWTTATSPPAPVIAVGPGGCIPARSTSRTDMDCDGCVDELIEFSYSFGAKCGESWYNQDADFDANGTVDGQDLSVFINDFGKGCF